MARLPYGYRVRENGMSRKNLFCGGRKVRSPPGRTLRSAAKTPSRRARRYRPAQMTPGHGKNTAPHHPAAKYLAAAMHHALTATHKLPRADDTRARQKNRPAPPRSQAPCHLRKHPFTAPRTHTRSAFAVHAFAVRTLATPRLCSPRLCSPCLCCPHLCSPDPYSPAPLQPPAAHLAASF